jgi:transcriptional regulator with XRE-family HTH domain
MNQKRKKFPNRNVLFIGKKYIIYMERISFWSRVKEELKAHRYSQKDLAEYAGIALQTLRGWIHYGRIPDAVTACSIAEALGVTVEYLVRGSDDINAKYKMRRTYARKTAAEHIKTLVLKIKKETERLRL